MHVLKYFLSTLTLVAAVVAAVFGFIHRDQVLREASLLGTRVSGWAHDGASAVSGMANRVTGSGKTVGGERPAPVAPAKLVTASTAPAAPASDLQMPSAAKTKAPAPSAAAYPPEDYAPPQSSAAAPAKTGASAPVAVSKDTPSKAAGGGYAPEGYVPPSPPPSPAEPKSTQGDTAASVSEAQTGDAAMTPPQGYGYGAPPPGYGMPPFLPPGGYAGMPGPAPQPPQAGSVGEAAPAGEPMPQPGLADMGRAQPARPEVVGGGESPASAPAVSRAAAPASQMESSLRTSWVEARQAFWAQDLARAEEIYLRLVRDNADEADLPGELGNVYLVEGRVSEASDQYLEAGLRAIRAGNRARAGAVVAILARVDRAKADLLRQKLFDSRISQVGR
ncbi:MAG: hypothetical protein ABT940_01485 [Alphaproteobacteria bacterium]